MGSSRKWLVIGCWASVGLLAPQLVSGQEAAKPEGDFAAANVGTVTAGPGKPSGDQGEWNQFRGPQRDGVVHAAKNLYRKFPEGGPKVLWTIKGLGVGYSGPAVYGGKVYFHDYDEQNKLWMARCVSLADGQEIWRWSYNRLIRANHGITRSMPVVDDKFVISLDPKCVLHCFDAGTGKRLWAKDLVAGFGAVIPQWYNGQCPLDGGDRVIVGIGGREALMAAFDKAIGRALWQTPNPDKMQLSHSSVMPMTLAGRKQYVWSTMKGLVGVDASDGKLLWRGPADEAGKLAWQPSTAIAPSPLEVGGDRVFMTSSYKAGCVMFRVAAGAGGGLVARSLYTRTFSEFASDCHTPIMFQGRLFAVNGEKFSCFDPDSGKVVWASPDGVKFGLGNFILADGLFYLIEGDTGKLHVLEASVEGYKELAAAQVLGGDNVWAPMALVNGKLILRDMSQMVCIEAGPAE